MGSAIARRAADRVPRQVNCGRGVALPGSPPRERRRAADLAVGSTVIVAPPCMTSRFDDSLLHSIGLGLPLTPIINASMSSGIVGTKKSGQRENDFHSRGAADRVPRQVDRGRGVALPGVALACRRWSPPPRRRRRRHHLALPAPKV